MDPLRLENSDDRVIYGPRDLRWSSVQMNGANGEPVTVMSTPEDTSFARLLLQFRGTGFKFFGGGVGDIFISFDEQDYTRIEAPPALPGSIPILELTDLEDTDHQLFILARGLLWVDHFILESSTGEGFDLLDHGPKAKSVPEKATLIEDTSNRITRSPAESWSFGQDEIYSANSVLATDKTGTSLTFTFEGVAIWYYADFDTTHGARRISIDGLPAVTISTKLSAGHIFQRLVWHQDGLEPNVAHNLTIEHAGTEGQYMTLDFLRVLASEDSDSLGSSSGSSSSPSSTSSDSPAPSGKSSVNVTGIAVGVTLGVLALVGVAVFFLWRVRRKRKAAPVDAMSQPNPYPIFAPPAGPPPTKIQSAPPNYQAERPSLDDSSPPYIAHSSGLQSPAVSFSPNPLSSGPGTDLSTNEQQWSQAERPSRTGKYS